MTPRRTDPATSRRPLARRTARAALAVAVATTLLLGSTAAVAGAAATTAARPAAAAAAPRASLAGFLQSINDLRASLGLGGLRSSSHLNAVAQAWTERMAAAGGISHNPNLAGDVGPTGWRMLGENVGVGWDVLGLMKAFIASPGHYANLVHPRFDFVGLGEVLLPDGRLFTTHVFMQSEAAPTPAPPVTAPPAPAPKPAPAPTTTAPPATTTTTLPPPPPPAPEPTPTRVAAVLDLLRTFDPAA